jgi:hypothetical protein
MAINPNNAARPLREAEELARQDINRLIRLQARLHRFYLQACNGPELTENDKADQTMLEENITGMMAGYGLAVEFNSDPRGNPVFVFEEGRVEYDRQPCNDIGGRGWAIW